MKKMLIVLLIGLLTGCSPIKTKTAISVYNSDRHEQLMTTYYDHWEELHINDNVSGTFKLRQWVNGEYSDLGNIDLHQDEKDKCLYIGAYQDDYQIIISLTYVSNRVHFSQYYYFDSSLIQIATFNFEDIETLANGDSIGAVVISSSEDNKESLMDQMYTGSNNGLVISYEQ